MILPANFYPYWSVYDHRGEKYCDCSHEKYAITTLELHEGEEFTYKRVDAPRPLPPYIVDVTAEHEGELPGQHGLPEHKRRLPFEPENTQLKQSNLKEIELNYD